MFNQSPFRNDQQQQQGYGYGYAQPGIPQTVADMSPASRSSLMSKVMWFTGFSILAAATGGVFGVTNFTFGRGTYILAVIAEFALLFAAMAFRERQGINFVLLYSFAFVSGLTISPILNYYLYRFGGPGIILQALAATAGITFALGSYATVTRRDFTRYGGYLFAGLIGLLVVGLVGIFVHSTVLNMFYSLAGAALFSVYIIFDIQRARYVQDTVGNAIAIAISLYLDIVNLFLFLLRILGMVSRSN